MSVRVVVGAAIVRDGRVLAARRSAPAELAGGWEFPGGKVEPGESDADALARECREELGIVVGVGELLAAAPIGPQLELRIYRADPIDGEPVAMQDHDALRWLMLPSELDSVRWLAADLPAVGALRDLDTPGAS